MSKKKRRSGTQGTFSDVAKMRAQAGLPALTPAQQMNFSAEMAAKTAYVQEQIAINRPYSTSFDRVHLHATSPTIYACANYRANAMAPVNFILTDRDVDPGETPTPLKDKSPEAQMLTRAFSRGMKNIMRRSELTYCFWGANLLQKRMDNFSGVTLEFRWLNPTLWTVDEDYSAGLKGFRISTSPSNPDVRYLPVDSTVYMHGIDFSDDFKGTAPAEAAFLNAGVETEIASTQLNFFRNHAIPSMIVQPAQGEGYKPNKDDRDQLAEYQRRMTQGSINAGRTLITPTRWEFKPMTTDFDKLAMKDLLDVNQITICATLEVPLELVFPQPSRRNVHEYEIRREWILTWLIPRAYEYCEIFTEQVVWPVNEKWQILPDFSNIYGIEEDINARTQTIKQQVVDGLLDLGTAQDMLGNEVDPNLKGLYMVGGIPVPSDQMKNYWRFAPGNPGMVTGGEIGKIDKPKRGGGGTKPTDSTAGTTSNAQTDVFEPDTPVESDGKSLDLADAVAREIKTWSFLVERKGAAYPFEGKSLRADAVQYGKLLLATAEQPSHVWPALKDYVAKAYDDTESVYRAGLYHLMLDAMDGNLDRAQFGQAGRAEISMAFESAFKNGLKSGGVDPSEMTDEERTVLDDETRAEKGYWTALSNELFREVIPLKGTDKYEPARDAMLSRIEMWVSKGLFRVNQLAGLYANANGMKRWVMDGTVEHCATCAAANGQVHRARSWLRRGITPRSEKCECQGYRCQCYFEDTSDPANGDLDAIPTVQT